MKSSGASGVLVVLESRATSVAAAREHAVLAAHAGVDAVLLAATAEVSPATLPFELADFAMPEPDGARASGGTASARDGLEAAGTLAAAVRDAGLAVAVAAGEPSVLGALGAGVDALYVPSPALTDLPWLERVAGTGAPLWLGTGMSTEAEVDEAVAVLNGARPRLTLVHGLETASARPDELNLRAIGTLRDRLVLPVGFRAGHAPAAACIAAVACGATLVVLPACVPGSLAALVRDLRGVAEALGDGVKRPQASEWPLRDRHQHSVVARVAIARGQIIDAGMLGTAPPGLGLKPRSLAALVGRRASAHIPAGTLLTLGMLE